jgi:signal transduction histidine kinase/CheY-like chemotaxis protein
MKPFQDWSIRHKLTGLFVAMALITAVLVSGGLGTFQYLGLRQDMLRDVDILADVLGRNSTAALTFHDARAARDVLEALRAEPSVTAACTYTAEGIPFAKYVRDGKDADFIPPIPQAQGSRFEFGHLVEFRTIVMDGGSLGTIYLDTNLQRLTTQFRQSSIAFLVTILVTLSVSFLIAFLFQQPISSPLIALVQTAKEISKGTDYTIRSSLPNRDEFGLLVSAFNGMLDQIQARDQQLRQHREHLEEEIASRTAELSAAHTQLKLHAKELAVSRDLAQSANRAKSMFLANMSHELRTPLNAILGYVQLLQRDHNVTKRQADAYSTIQQSGEQLLSLIIDILDLTKIEDGKFELQLGVVDMTGFLHEIVNIIRVKAEEKNLDFGCVIASDLPAFVHADKRHLRQVLLNLLSNAVKFTDRGRVDLLVKVIAQTQEEARLLFEVRDTGIGIARDQLENIFKPFEQVNDSAHHATGSGLGLYISRELVRAMGGKIRVESTLRQGSCFWFEIPARTAEPEQAGPSMMGQAIGYEGPRKKILVVDNIDADRAILVGILSSLGFQIEQAVNGLEALRRAQDKLPDIVLMAIGMPVMDGLEAMRRMQQIPDLRMIPVIAVSIDGKNERADSITAGAKGFLTKPIVSTNLVQEIGKLLNVAWVREDHQQESSLIDDVEEFEAPAPVEMESLLMFAKAGNMRAIQNEADQIAVLDAKYRPFADKISQMTQKYQSKALLRLIERYAVLKK